MNPAANTLCLTRCLLCPALYPVPCRYVLARMQEGKTDISAEKQDYEFSSLSAVSITPSAQVLPDISVTKLAICGRLTYGDMHFKRNSKKVTLTAVDGASLNLHTLADDFNRWCFMVPALGRYRVAPYVSADDRSKGLVVAPTHSDVSLVGEPVTNLSFGQAKLALHGSVLCLDGPCPDELMVVVHVASTGTKVLSGKVGNIPPDDPATVTGACVRARVSAYRNRAAAAAAGSDCVCRVGSLV